MREKNDTFIVAGSLNEKVLSTFCFECHCRILCPVARHFDPAPTTVRIHLCKYVSKCKAGGCLKRATLIAENRDAAGRHIRQIELCVQHCEIVIERERTRGLEIAIAGTNNVPLCLRFKGKKNRTGQRGKRQPVQTGERGANTNLRPPVLNCHASVNRPPEVGTGLIRTRVAGFEMQSDLICGNDSTGVELLLCLFPSSSGLPQIGYAPIFLNLSVCEQVRA